MSTATSTSILPPVPRRPAALQPPGDPSKRLAAEHREKIRRLREEVELKAAEYTSIMLDKHIAEALDPATDPKLRRDLRRDIKEWGIGRSREVEQDDPKDKEARARDLLEVLAAMSTSNFALEQQGKAAPRIERDVTPEQGQPLDIDLDEFKVEGDDDGH
jgi:hypothetical protein